MHPPQPNSRVGQMVYIPRDLKDATFCLAPQSQPLFAFERTELVTGHQMKLTWTQLPQGFKNSPTLFGEALATDLTNFPRETTECILLQYVDDILLANNTQENCTRGTKVLLQLLSDSEYQVSWKKAQICQQHVQYLGFLLPQGKRKLGLERKKVIITLHSPKQNKAYMNS